MIGKRATVKRATVMMRGVRLGEGCPSSPSTSLGAANRGLLLHASQTSQRWATLEGRVVEQVEDRYEKAGKTARGVQAGWMSVRASEAW